MYIGRNVRILIYSSYSNSVKAINLTPYEDCPTDLIVATFMTGKTPSASLFTHEYFGYTQDGQNIVLVKEIVVYNKTIGRSYSNLQDAVDDVNDSLAENILQVMKDLVIDSTVRIENKTTKIIIQPRFTADDVVTNGFYKRYIYRAPNFISDMFYILNSSVEFNAEYEGNNAGSFNISGVTLNEDGTTSSDIISIGSIIKIDSGTLTIGSYNTTSDVRYIYLEDNKTSANGAGINAPYGQVTINIIGDTRRTSNIITNETSANGGGIYMSNPSSVINLTNSVIDSNQALDGGGVYIQNGTFNFDGTEDKACVSNNIAERGGAIYNVSGTLNLNGGILYSNEAMNGAGIFMYDGNAILSGTVIQTNFAKEERGSGVQFLGNTHDGIGGGIYINDGTFTYNSGKIDSNFAGWGGGVYMAGGTFTMTTANAKITRNRAGNEEIDSGGGGFYLAGGTLNFNAGTIGGESTFKKGEYNPNTSSGPEYSWYHEDTGPMGNSVYGGNGGGIYISSKGTLNVTNGVISGNYAGWCDIYGYYRGDYTYNSDGYRRDWYDYSDFYSLVEDNEYSDNYNMFGGKGGGVYFERRTTSYTISANLLASLQNNCAFAGGAGAFMGGTYTISSGTLSGNYAYIGGGFFFGNATVTLSGATISGNSAGEMGAGLALEKSTLSITRGSISNNIITTQSYKRLGYDYWSPASASGVGIQALDSKITMSGGEVSNNIAKALFVNGEPDGVQLSQLNSALFNGIGMHMMATRNGTHSFSLSGGTIHNNRYEADNGISFRDYYYGGGGIFFAGDGGNFRMSGGSVYNNRINGNGGGIMIGIGHNHESSGQINFSGGSIYNNYANGSGGGVHISSVSYSKAYITYIKVYGNVAEKEGGGMYLSGPCYLGNSNGTGAPTIGDTTKNKLPTSTDYSNKAKSGGGLTISGQAIIYCANIQYNYASENGGGIGCWAYEFESRDKLNVKYNYAEENGGGMYLHSQVVQSGNYFKLYGSFTYNEAGNMGGGLCNFCHDNTVDRFGIYAKVQYNKAKLGGGIAFETLPNQGGLGGETQGKYKIKKGADISYNIATQSGGGIYVMPDDSDNHWVMWAALYLEGGRITNNTANTSSGYGGGIFIDKGSRFYYEKDATTYTTEISNNKAAYGGGIAHFGFGVFFNKSIVNIYNNTATYAGGGFYYQDRTMELNNNALNMLANNEGAFAVNGVNIYNNKVTNGVGGGLCIGNYATNPDTYDLSQISFGNTYRQSDTYNKPVNIYGNTATYGAGIYVTESGFLDINSVNVDIYNNTATADGGGVYSNEISHGGWFQSGYVTREYGTWLKIRKNNAKRGGGIYVKSSATNRDHNGVELGITDSKDNRIFQIDGNTAQTAGGGIYLESGRVDLGENVYVINNTVTASGGKGGGIYITGGSFKSMTYHSATVLIRNNTADYGGGVAVCGGTSTVRGYIAKNRAKYGGGVYVSGGDVNIYGWVGYYGDEWRDGYAPANESEAMNVATVQGGGVYIVGGKVYLDAHVKGNYCGTGYGGVYKAGGTLNYDSYYITQLIRWNYRNNFNF